MHPQVMLDYVRERHERLIVDAERRRRQRRRSAMRLRAELGRLLVAAGHMLAGQASREVGLRAASTPVCTPMRASYPGMPSGGAR